MSKRLFIGNLSYNTTEDKLKEVFGTDNVVIPVNETGRPKGFGFVEIEDEDQANKLMEQWNGQELDGRNIVVNEARPREDRSNRPHGGYQRDNQGSWNNR